MPVHFKVNDGIQYFARLGCNIVVSNFYISDHFVVCKQNWDRTAELAEDIS